MPPSYDKQLLEKIVQQTEENNQILKTLRSHSRWGVFFGFIKWAIIIGPIILAYIYLQPYLGNFQEQSKIIMEQFKKIQSLPLRNTAPLYNKISCLLAWFNYARV